MTTIFGDGVNIAARLEGIAEPGGICISDDAQRQIRGKVDFVFDDLGPQTLKNIAELMRAWHIRLAGEARSCNPRKFVTDTSSNSSDPRKTVHCCSSVRQHVCGGRPRLPR
jgi:hypothetical protein